MTDTSADFYRRVGKNIATVRSLAGMTQQNLADRVSLSRTTIANIETGRQSILFHIFLQIAGALDCSPQVLLFGVPTKARETSIREKVLSLEKMITQHQAFEIRKMRSL